MATKPNSVPGPGRVLRFLDLNGNSNSALALSGRFEGDTGLATLLWINDDGKPQFEADVPFAMGDDTMTDLPCRSWMWPDGLGGTDGRRLRDIPEGER